jgi:hypothetical protein
LIDKIVSMNAIIFARVLRSYDILDNITNKYTTPAF